VHWRLARWTRGTINLTDLASGGLGLMIPVAPIGPSMLPVKKLAAIDQRIRWMPPG